MHEYFGKSLSACSLRLWGYESLHTLACHSSADTGLSDQERTNLIAQVTAASRMPRAVWNKLQSLPGQSFSSGTFPSDYLLRKALSKEAKLNTKLVDCCVNGCRAFTRSFENDTVCDSCLEARYASDVSQLVETQIHTRYIDVEYIALHFPF